MLAVCIDVRVLPSGSWYGGMYTPLYNRPVAIGRSGLPSKNSMITSQLMRGRIIEPDVWS